MTGLPLILLPGLLCDAALWEHQVAAFAPVREVTVADLTQDATIADMAARVLAAAPPRFALAGLSMGGYVAFEILRQAPGRVAALALLATSARPDTPVQARERQGAIAALGLGQFQGVTGRLLARLIHPDRLGGPVAQGVRTMTGRFDSATFVRQQQAIAGRGDARPLLPAIAVPTLVLAGMDDAMIDPTHAAEIAALIPGARLEPLPHCGRLPSMELPAETTAAMAGWLDRADAPTPSSPRAPAFTGDPA